MNNIAITLLALGVSFLAMLYLRNTDPKRRRSHRLPTLSKKRYQRLGWILSLTPGLVLLLLHVYPAFIMWFAAFSLIGWFIALPKPS